MPSVMARRETPVARATAETPPYPIASLSAAATKRRIRSSRKGDRERNRRWISLPGTSCSIKQIYPNLLYLFSDNTLGRSWGGQVAGVRLVSSPGFFDNGIGEPAR